MIAEKTGHLDSSRMPARVPEMPRSSIVARSRSGESAVTFDVFETLLIRAVSPHQAVFDRVGIIAAQEGRIKTSAFAFSRAREAAERRAIAARGDQTTLSHIYAELAAVAGMQSRDVDRLQNIEMEEEARLLRPIDGVRYLVERSRAIHGRAVFISDMYLPVEFIQQQLERHGFWHERDELFVSHAHGCSKRTGQLFEYVASALSIPVTGITHYGNSAKVDVRGAQKAGAVGHLIDTGNPNRYEIALQKYRHESDGLTSAMAGASRIARSRASVDGKDDPALVDVAAGVVAPVLTAYVLWLLRQASCLKLKRLYFVSRDGEILLHIAQRLIANLHIDLEVRYLYGSRYAWNSSVSSPRHNKHIWNSLIWLSSNGVSNEDILERTGITVVEKAELVQSRPENAKKWKSATDREVLKEALAQLDSEGALERAAARNKHLLKRYLQQEGLFDDVPHGFVDVGWRGTQHDTLIDLQREQNVAPAFGLFFGLEQSQSQWDDLREAFYFDSRSSSITSGENITTEGGDSPINAGLRRSNKAPKHLFSLFEMFCAGQHGSLVSYVDEGSSIIPVLDPSRDDEVSAWGLDIVYDVVGEFASSLQVSGKIENTGVELAQALADVIDLFWSSPSRAEARKWGSFPWETGQGSSRSYCDFGPALDDMITNRLSRSVGKSETLSTQWPQGSRTRSNRVLGFASAPRRTITGAAKRIARGALPLARKWLNRPGFT
jgi:FMN phosphatase YigB (HAD superfamily)